jgi:hypothetical protein
LFQAFKAFTKFFCAAASMSTIVDNHGNILSSRRSRAAHFLFGLQPIVHVVALFAAPLLVQFVGAMSNSLFGQWRFRLSGVTV